MDSIIITDHMTSIGVHLSHLMLRSAQQLPSFRPLLQAAEVCRAAQGYRWTVRERVHRNASVLYRSFGTMQPLPLLCMEVLLIEPCRRIGAPHCPQLRHLEATSAVS